MRRLRCLIGLHDDDNPRIDRMGITLRCIHCGRHRTCRLLPIFLDGWDEMNGHVDQESE